MVDCLSGRRALCQSVEPINLDATRFAGVALTCDAGPADSLAVFGAIHLAEPGSAGFPITVGGVQVSSGDVIVDDRDGVVVLPFKRIDEVSAKLDEVLATEVSLDDLVSKGLKMPEFTSSILEDDRVVWVG